MASFFQGTVEGQENGSYFADECRPCQTIVDGEGIEEIEEHRYLIYLLMGSVKDEQSEDTQDPSNHPGEDEDEHDQRDSREGAFQLSMSPLVPSMLECRYHLAKPHHRVG